MKILYRFKVYGGGGSLALYAAHGLLVLLKQLEKHLQKKRNKTEYNYNKSEKIHNIVVFV